MDRHGSTPAELAARLAAERRGNPFLVYRDGDGAQRLLELEPERERITIGRRPQADVALGWDEEVSRLHAVLEFVAGEWTVVDDGLSQNGTFVGPGRITGRRRLNDGDELRCGRTRLVFTNPRRGRSRPTATSAELPAVARISDAQRRVLVALCRPYAAGDGFAIPATNQQVADELFLSVDAVKSHLRALFEKFAIGDVPQNRKRAQLVERALTTGIVTERDLRAPAQ
jgi:pSer/pThr/pTyr-binding forkhead associated (FHA) protein